ncbi:TPA: helix-turn-helix domain-containing protein, partial [Streptococcus pneumoniae]
MKLGELLKSYRTEHKLSMDAFCELSDLTKGYISMLEKNEHPKSKKPIVPSYDTIEKIAKGMQISTEDLIDMLDDDQEIQINATPALLSKSPIQTIYDELEPPRQGKVLNYAKRQLDEQENEEETKINEVSENIIRLDDYRQTTYRRVTGVVSAGSGSIQD